MAREARQPATITVSSLLKLRKSSLLPSIRQLGRRLKSPQAATSAKGHLTQYIIDAQGRFRGKKEPFPPEYVLRNWVVLCTWYSIRNLSHCLGSTGVFRSGHRQPPKDEKADVDLSVCRLDLVGFNGTGKSDTRWKDEGYSRTYIPVSMERVFIRQSHPSMQSKTCGKSNRRQGFILGIPRYAARQLCSRRDVAGIGVEMESRACEGSIGGGMALQME